MKFPSSILSILAVGAIASAAIASAASAAEVPTAQENSDAECPAVVVLAARGSDQNLEDGEYFGPQRYSANSAESNGWEGPNWTAFFHYVEAKHQVETGTSLMDDVYVLGLDDDAYPATMELPPLAEEGENLTSAQTSSRLWTVLTTNDIPALVRGVTIGALDSMQDGMHNAPGFVDRWEAETGCAPQYITAGYSQGPSSRLASNATWPPRVAC